MTTETALHSLIETIGALRAEIDAPVGLAVIESTMRRAEMPPLHSHDVEEAFYLLEGTMTIHAGDQSVRLESGDTYVARRDVPHTHCAHSDRVRYLSLTFARSVSRYEDFLRAVAVPSGSEGWHDSDEAATVAGIARANRIAVLAPPGKLPAG